MRVAVLTLVVALFGCDASQKDWEAARAANTRDAYEGFVRAHPKSEYAPKAGEAIREIDRAEAARTAAEAARVAAEAKERKSRAALEVARKLETVPAFRRVEREHAGSAAASEARSAIDELRSQRRAEVRELDRVSITINAPAALAAVPIGKAAAEILALAGVDAGPPETADATLRIEVRSSTESGTYFPLGRYGQEPTGRGVERTTGATVAGNLHFEVRRGGKFSRAFTGRVPRAEGIGGGPADAPPYFEAAGLNHTDDPQRSYSLRYDSVVDPGATLAVRLVHLVGELFGPSVGRAALIEPTRFRWAVLRATTLRNDPRMVDALIRLLPSAEEDRQFVVGALGRSGDQRAVPPLLPLLAEGPFRLPAVEALGSLGDRRAALPLVEVLESFEKDKGLAYQRDHVLRALRQIAGRNVGTEPGAWRRWAETVASR